MKKGEKNRLLYFLNYITQVRTTHEALIDKIEIRTGTYKSNSVVSYLKHILCKIQAGSAKPVNINEAFSILSNLRKGKILIKIQILN